jgi:hypothetical protein
MDREPSFGIERLLEACFPRHKCGARMLPVMPLLRIGLGGDRVGFAGIRLLMLE